MSNDDSAGVEVGQ